MGANVNHYKARLSRVLLEQYQNAAGSLVCSSAVAPHAGQYLQAHDPSDDLDATSHSLFVSGLAEPQAHRGELEFDIAGLLPDSWQPGTQLLVRGPLGRGFNLPRSVRKLALAAIHSSPGRLLPLLAQASAAEVTLFCDQPGGELPMHVEQQGLENLPSATAWADFLGIDIAIEDLDELPNLFGLKQSLPKKIQAQVLVRSAMPCCGLAQCGVCAIATSKGAKLVCEDGPVFELSDLV